MRAVRFIAPIFIIALLVGAGVVLWMPNLFSIQTAAKQSTTTVKTIEMGAMIGEATDIGEAKVVVERVLEDSRCPRGVECIRAGTVRVLATIEEEGNVATGTLTLGSVTRLGSFDISLVGVTPEPTPGFPIGTYRFEIVGTRAEDSGSGATTTTPVGATGPTGIRGLALLTPGCPVEREGAPCPPLPAEGMEIRATDIEGNEIARTKTDAEGRFLFLLPPGLYIVERMDASAMPSFAPMQVAVPDAGLRDVLIEADSGIR